MTHLRTLVTFNKLQHSRNIPAANMRLNYISIMSQLCLNLVQMSPNTLKLSHIPGCFRITTESFPGDTVQGPPSWTSGSSGNSLGLLGNSLANISLSLNVANR